jgi:hypothetical protein
MKVSIPSKTSKSLTLAVQAILSVWTEGVIEELDNEGSVLQLGDLPQHSGVLVFKDKATQTVLNASPTLEEVTTLCAMIVIHDVGMVTCVVEDLPETTKILDAVMTALDGT